jgi:hypothetical protein
MPGFAKFLVFMNFVAACGFLYLATIDFNARRPWAYQAFRGELAVDGLPLDERDPGPRRVDIALGEDLEKDTLADMFKDAGGNPEKGGKLVRTQKDEVLQIQNKLEAALKAKGDDDDKRQLLKEVFLPLAYTLEERDYWNDRLAKKDADVNELQKDMIDDYFGRALKDDDEDVPREKSDWIAGKKNYPAEKPHSRLTRRQKIAHLLFNLGGEFTNHQRVVAMIGLRNYINEAEGQAARLRELSLRTRMAMINERGDFEEQYQRLIGRLYALLEELETKKQFYKDKEGVKTRTAELVKIREEDYKELKGKVGEANDKIKAALMEQETLEQRVFDTQKKLGEILEQTEELQYRVRRMEGVGGR